MSTLSRFMHNPVGSFIGQAGSLLIGVTLPIGAYLYLTDDTGALTQRFQPDTPIEAVMTKLPQVAVLGTKAGPADTTEVYIQVPGVLNMQSVYVLSDNETVISGFVLSDMESGGLPGGQLEVPTGQSTVDPRAPRGDETALLELLGMQQSPRQQPEARERSQAPQSHASDQAPRPMTAEDAEAMLAQIQKAQQQVQPQAPAQPAPANIQQRPINSIPAPQSAPSAIPTPTVSQPSPEPAQAPEHLESVAKERAPRNPESTHVPAEPTMTLAELNTREKFGAGVQQLMDNDPDIAEVRKAEGDQEQQGAFLDMVKNRPAVTQGNGGKQVYVMFDPNCPVCHDFYRQNLNAANSDQVTIHWIPAVVFPNRPSSLASSATLLSLAESEGNQPALSLFERMMRSTDAIEQTRDDFSGAAESKLMEVVKNTATMAMARPETPLIVYTNTQGNLTIDSGIPDQGWLNNVADES